MRAIWRALVGAEPHAIVCYMSGDPFEPDHWWRTTTDAMAVSREWFGVLNAWAGFPVIDRMQLEVREYLSLHPAETAGTR